MRLHLHRVCTHPLLCVCVYKYRYTEKSESYAYANGHETQVQRKRIDGIMYVLFISTNAIFFNSLVQFSSVQFSNTLIIPQGAIQQGPACLQTKFKQTNKQKQPRINKNNKTKVLTHMLSLLVS